MGDKSIWQEFGDLLGGNASKSRAKALPTVEQRCPVCLNALDPRWTRCPYCEAAKNAGNPSTRIVSEPAGTPPTAGSAGQGSRRLTQVDTGEAASDDTQAAAAMPDDGVRGTAAGGVDGAANATAGGGGRRPTVVEPMPEEGAGPGAEPRAGGSGGARGGGGGRRLTGIVTTFTWSRLGQLHEIRDGRNYAGSGVVSSDNNAPCEIQVPEDRTMSGAHFLILCQGSKYIVSDNFSTNGTFVDGEQIDTRGVELVDNAVIRAGATVFRFQKITAAAAVGAAEPARKSAPGPVPSDIDDPPQ